MAKGKRPVVVSDEAGMLARMTVFLTDEEIDLLPRRPAGYSLRRLTEDRHHFRSPADAAWVEGKSVLCAWIRPYAVFRASIDDVLDAEADPGTGARTVPCTFQNRPDLERLHLGTFHA